ncbi:SDR family oxidoreductase [Pseudooceanicola sp. CBS1P-1]|uniref:SDR family oxidoreductase n=1 Tax=Pseudooceanicola albus TaxID=2692189 RepID=A0A6L7G9W4_9RHOB|nr:MULTISPECIES: SDR family oxidoreductase [Pseudooceanicola]MBT9386370.1 SDR family oxidoreductase [Pseudooceanicola endophyticus]MXN20472.1 SDR family oxidoreductase [Pseudooceanicola albus]
MTFSIAGKTAIVTGAANGIGLAIGKLFADKGANVVLADMDEERLKAELGDLVADEGNIRYFAGDLREKLTIANLLSTTLDAFDRVDILVNASRQVMPSDPLDPDDEAVEVLLQQNLMTALRVSQAVARRMIKQAEEAPDAPAGAIVNLSSIAARRTHPELMAFSVSTAALDQMTRSLAVALAPHRIRVNAVAFGSVMSTSLMEQLRENDAYRGDIEGHTPLSRIAPPSELAEAVQYLACDASSFMTGQIMTVDGGRTLLDPVAAPAH